MSINSINTRQKYLLNGKQSDAPLDWQDVQIEAIYKGDNVQPSLVVDNFKFPLDARVAINKWITDGISNGVGIFEGMPFDLSVYNNTGVQHNFKSYIDFTSGYKDFVEDGVVDVKIIKDNSIDNFFDQLGSISYGYLEEIDVFTDNSYTQVNYINEKKFNLLEILMASVVLYLMIKELAEAIEKLANAIADVSGLTLGGSILPPTAALGAALLGVLKALLIAVYVAVLLAAITELGKTLLEILIPKERKHKTLNLNTALRNVCRHLGYGFSTGISEMKDVYYLPSNPNLDETTAGGFISITRGTQSGIPANSDYGYICEDMFQLCKDLFNAKIAIVNGVVHLRSKNDPYWIQQSTWKFPNAIVLTKEYNTEELRADRLLTFSADLNDEWTIDNYLGTAYEIRTEPKTIIRKNAVLLKGLDEIKFNTALGNRKDQLNGLEEFLKEVAGAIDGMLNFFGGSSDLAGQITSRIGVLKQTQNWHSIPKLLFLKDGKLPADHRKMWNAKLLYDKYHNHNSFVLNNFGYQKVYYKGVEIPFGFSDYEELTNNSYFKYKGATAKIIRFAWTMGSDRAVVDFWVKEVYTRNLKETYINPE